MSSTERHNMQTALQFAVQQKEYREDQMAVILAVIEGRFADARAALDRLDPQKRQDEPQGESR